jgi:uncharacterized SAM-binding protein YcdF (DUF218 family)
VSRLLAKIVWSFLFCITVWLCGLGWFIAQVPKGPSEDTRPTDAIVVLTGGAGRLEYGFKLLAQGRGKKLFISGAGSGTTAAEFLRRAPAEFQPALSEHDIALGHTAENTIGNAAETVLWLNKEKYTSIRLVTSGYHMPRSVAEFQEVAPNITIIPAPVFGGEFAESWWSTREGRVLILSEYHKYLASKFRHWLVSVIRKT